MENQNRESYIPQSYPAQQFQQVPGTVTGRPQPPLVSSRGWHIAKLVLHSLTVVFDIVVLGIVIAVSLNYSASSAVALIWTVPQVGVSLCWAVAEMITVCVRHGQRGIHPGAHVALHLLLWIGLSVGLALNVILFVAWLLYYDYDYDYYSHFDYYYDYLDMDSKYLPLMRALVAFIALLIITHFILFVRACVETSRRNKASAPIYMMPVQMYQQPPPLPQQQQQQQQQYAAPGGYPPVQPQAAHLSGQYDQGKEIHQPPQHAAQFDHNSVSGHLYTAASSPPPIHDDGLHMHPPR